MIRQIKKKADAIFTADWHLRDSVPPCRTDNFEQKQWDKVQWIGKVQEEHDCPVLHAGDLFHHWKPSPYLLSQTIKHLPEQFITIYGNHDLPQYSLELANKCGVHLLSVANALVLYPGAHWGIAPEMSTSYIIKGRRVLMTHIMTYQGKTPYPGCKDTPASGLLRKYKGCDVFLSGHNHQSFVEEHVGRLLVNPGCITRQESDQAEFRPKIYLYYAEDNTVLPLEIPCEQGVVIRPENVQKVEERNNRIDAFIAKLQGEWDSSIDFEKNLERFLAENEITDEVKRIITKSINTIE